MSNKAICSKEINGSFKYKVIEIFHEVEKICVLKDPIDRNVSQETRSRMAPSHTCEKKISSIAFHTWTCDYSQAANPMKLFCL